MKIIISICQRIPKINLNKQQMTIYLFALRDINKGVELSKPYGSSYWKEYEKMISKYPPNSITLRVAEFVRTKLNDKYGNEKWHHYLNENTAKNAHDEYIKLTSGQF